MTKDARARIAGWIWFAIAWVLFFVAGQVPDEYMWLVLGGGISAIGCAWQLWGFREGYRQGQADAAKEEGP